MRNSMSTLLRARLAEGQTSVQTMVMPGAFNAMSAKIIADGGFAVMALPEDGLAATLLGTAKAGLITLDEMAVTARYITAAVKTPLLVDAGGGHGNAINAMRTADMFIRAGAAGMYLADQDGDDSRDASIPVEEASGKLAACAHVRDELDPDFLVIARLDGRAGLNDVIDRAKAYVAAGADLIYPRGLVGAEQIAHMWATLQTPVVLDRAENLSFPASGVANVADTGQALRWAAGAMWNYLNGFAGEDVDYVLRFLDQVKQHPTGNMHEFVGFPAIRELEERFLSKEDMVARYENSLGYKP